MKLLDFKHQEGINYISMKRLINNRFKEYISKNQ